MPLWPLPVQAVPALVSVSSQVSQVPHGVGPPAQLVEVPEMPTHSPRLRPRAVGLDDGAAAAVQRGRVVDRPLDVGYAERRAGGELVVLDQAQPPAGRVEDGGPVVVRRRRLPGLELGLAGVGHDPVAEPGGQRQQALRVVDQRREGTVRVSAACPPPCPPPCPPCHGLAAASEGTAPATTRPTPAALPVRTLRRAMGMGAPLGSTGTSNLVRRVQTRPVEPGDDSLTAG